MSQGSRRFRALEEGIDRDTARRILRAAGPLAFVASFPKRKGQGWFAMRYISDADRKKVNPDGELIETPPWQRAQEILAGPARSAGEAVWLLEHQVRGYSFEAGARPRPIFDADGRWVGLAAPDGRKVDASGTAPPPLNVA